MNKDGILDNTLAYESQSEAINEGLGHFKTYARTMGAASSVADKGTTEELAIRNKQGNYLFQVEVLSAELRKVSS